jgi:hypothetical protein
MKFKDILIILFLAGLLMYAACHRAGFVGSAKINENIADAMLQETALPVSIQFDNWIFSAHPENGLKVSTGSGDTIHHIPHFRSINIEVIAEPDTTGQTLGLLIVNGDMENEPPRFRMLKNGQLERVNS